MKPVETFHKMLAGGWHEMAGQRPDHVFYFYPVFRFSGSRAADGEDNWFELFFHKNPRSGLMRALVDWSDE